MFFQTWAEVAAVLDWIWPSKLGQQKLEEGKKGVWRSPREEAINHPHITESCGWFSEESYLLLLEVITQRVRRVVPNTFSAVHVARDLAYNIGNTSYLHLVIYLYI